MDLPPVSALIMWCGADTGLATFVTTSPNWARITLQALNNAREGVILALGQDKAGAVRDALQGEIDIDSHPVQAIRPVDVRILWVIDQKAA